MISKLKKRDQNIIKRIMNERDLPGWFCALSEFQFKAAISLLDCIRDDIQQGTSHRVRDALRRIGIEPVVRPSKIKLVMRLSRGNDIAFLWFLMELYYRSSSAPIGRFYKFSAIEQTFLTIIAYLDSRPTLRELNKLIPKQIEIEKVKKPDLPKRKKKPMISPYFEKQPRPELYGKKLTMNEPARAGNFDAYNRFLNPNYVSYNEHNRWFANFKLTKNKSMANKVIYDRIDSVFDENVPENLNLCAHHQTLQLMKEKLANELRVAKQKACENYFDIEKHLKSASNKRVIKQLNSDINRIEKDFEQYRNNAFRRIPGAIKDNNHTKIKDDCLDGIPLENSELYNFDLDFPIEIETKYFKAPTEHTPYKFNYGKIFDTNVCKDVFKDAIVSALDLSDSSGNNSIDQNRIIKKYCKKAWTEKVKEHETKLNKRIEHTKDNNLTILKKDWKQQQSALNLPPQSKLENRAESKLSLIIQHERDRVPYDPVDTDLVHSILASALKEIRKDKRYVLATLPHAYKYPLLREWVRNRFGRRYTRKEKLKAYLRTKKIFLILRKNALNVRIPQTTDISKKTFVSYGCRDYVVKKTNYLKEKYKSELSESMIRDSRMYWAAIRPFQCTQGPPRKVFFAYMPPRRCDVTAFRPWKSREFMRAQEGWNKRIIKKRKELSL